MEITNRQRLLKIAVKGGYWKVADQIAEAWELDDYMDYLIGLYYPEEDQLVRTAGETQQQLDAAREGYLA